MNVSNLRELSAYILVSCLAVGMAAFLSLQFLKPVSSQESDVSSSEEPAVSPRIERDDSAPRPTFPQIGGETANTARELEVFLEPFIYASGGRRNPFEAYEDKASERSAPLGPLQKFSLSELSLVGIMWDVRNPKAMFVDPTSMVHVVGRDEGIGQKNGYIAAIREGEVVVVEAEQKESGIVYETKVIRLPR